MIDDVFLIFSEKVSHFCLVELKKKKNESKFGAKNLFYLLSISVDIPWQHVSKLLCFAVREAPNCAYEE